MNIDDLYFKDNFTKEDEKVNLDINRLTLECLNSKNNKFNLDSEGNLSVNSITTITPIISANIANAIYPIGSIYMNISNINPESIFGGTWDKVEDMFLLGASNNYELGTSGGEDKHTLNIDEMPSHNHQIYLPFYKFQELAYGVNGQVFKGEYYCDNYYNTELAGGNQPHNNMPPYLAVNIWKRVA